MTRCWIGTHERLTGPVVVWTAQEAGERRRNGWEMVEYAPADQLTGAVERVDQAERDREGAYRSRDAHYQQLQGAVEALREVGRVCRQAVDQNEDADDTLARVLKIAGDPGAAVWASQFQGAVEAARDADVASMQAAFWRARAIELGADPDEWAKRDREVFGGQ